MFGEKSMDGGNSLYAVASPSIKNPSPSTTMIKQSL